MSGPEPGPYEEPAPERSRPPGGNHRVHLLIAAGGVLLLGAVLLYILMSPLPLQNWASRFRPAPQAEFHPPPSLNDLVRQYPELAPLLTDPELDSAYKQFLVAYREGGKEAAVDLARRRGLLNERDEIRLTLVLDTENSAPLAAQLQSIGVRVVSAYRDRVEIAVPLALVEEAAESESPGAIFRQLTELEHVIAVRVPALHAPDGSRISGEGIQVVGADSWHQAGWTGAGIRIGVLDMGFAGYQILLGRELPENVVVERFGDWDPEEVHGTACAEIIHEIAPGAELYFAWYDGSDAAEGAAVDWLLSQGVRIISHSAGGAVDPRDGTGWEARLVDSVAARGILWVNSIGNEAQSHYRAPFTDTDGDGVHEFTPGRERMAVYPDAPLIKVFLIWDDIWGQAGQDYELYLTDSGGNVLASSERSQDGAQGQDPAEAIYYWWGDSDETPYVAVQAYRVDRPATLEIFVYGGDVAYPSPEYSLLTPADAVGAVAVGAAHWRRDTLTDYSSRGPTTDGRLKPDISAPTNVSTASYGEPFSGTSASAPHVAGAAALVWQAYPAFTRQQVVDFLLTHAVDRGPNGPDVGYGYGRLQLPPPPSSAGPSPPPAGPSPSPVGTVSPPPRLPTPTPVAFAAPETSSPSSSVWMLFCPGLLIGGMGLLGLGLLVFGLTVWMRGRREFAPPPMRPAAQGAFPSYPTPSPPAPHYPPPDWSPPPPEWSSPPPTPPSPMPTASVTCPRCGASLRPGARFCSRCGYSLSPLPTHCSFCGAPLRPGARFCPRCGRPV